MNEIVNNTNLTDEQIIEIAKYFDCEPEDIEELDYDNYDLPILDILGDDHCVALNYDEVEIAVKEYIKDSIWCFTDWFICDHCSSDISLKSIQKIQELYEDANEIILELINDLDEFVLDAIGLDGVGHFLASYDGEEIEIEVDKKLIYLYRID